LEIRERLRPLTKAISYAKNITSARTEAKSTISYNVVLQLIMEYLDSVGNLQEIIKAIEEESGSLYLKRSCTESRLITLLRIGRRRIRQKDVFSPDIGVDDYDEGDPEVEMLDHLPGKMEEKEGLKLHDVSIWDDPMDNSKDIIFLNPDSPNDKATIKAASINQLVLHLTPEKEQNCDLQFMKTFLYTYHSFMKPEALLKKLIQRYNVPPPKEIPEEKYRTEIQLPIRIRVCNVIKFWINKCGWDFNEKLLSILKAFIDGPLSRDGNLSSVKQLRNSINRLHKKKTFHDDERTYVFGINPPEPKVPRNIFSPSLSLKDIDELEIARQLTLIEFSIFTQIVPTEWLNKRWCDPDQKQHKALHITQMLSRYTDLTNWVIHTILTTDTKKNRARMIEKYIHIAENLKTLKNFQTFFAILTGLSSPLITTQSQTISELSARSKEILNDLLMITSKEQNNKFYRDCLFYASLPCIPFLYVFIITIQSASLNGF